MTPGTVTRDSLRMTRNLGPLRLRDPAALRRSCHWQARVGYLCGIVFFRGFKSVTVLAAGDHDRSGPVPVTGSRAPLCNDSES